MTFETTIEFAKSLDAQDELREYQRMFYRPMRDNNTPFIYLCGNSLGLQPITVEESISTELASWRMMGVEGHFHGKNPWMPYHENLTGAMSRIVGAKESEVIVMNTLSVNLHLMMVSFYRPTKNRYKILIEGDAFPSDKYAVASQAHFHGYDPKEAILELKPRDGEVCLRDEDIDDYINEHGDEIALILIGNTNYYTGQSFDMKRIVETGHSKGCMVGFDCAHGAGNLELNLHDTGADFAVWCTYKYLNSGPGSLSGAFIHERHHSDDDIPRFNGWWGTDKNTRFLMKDEYESMRTAESWQLSCPTILSMASIKASLEMFDKIGIKKLRAKAKHITCYLEFLINSLNNDRINIITPADPNKRGSQLSIQVKNADKSLFDKITDDGVIGDWREPDVIRITPTAIYNSYQDCYHFVQILKRNLG